MYVQSYDKHFDIEHIDSFYLILKDEVNKQLNNKYLLGIPGFKVYPHLVIQDFLKLFNDEFSNDCIIEYKDEFERYCKSYFYNLTQNCFLHDLKKCFHLQKCVNNKPPNIEMLNYNILKDYCEEHKYDYQYSREFCSDIFCDFSEIIDMPFKEINGKFYYEKYITYFINNIKKYPKNLLLACPLHDLTAMYMLNNKMKLYKFTYDDIKEYINYIKSIYNIHIRYPFFINLENNKYKLHSFIIVINKEKMDEQVENLKNFQPVSNENHFVSQNDFHCDHFVYYKIDYKNNDLLRFDENKVRMNKENINLFKKDFYKKEFNEIFLNDCNDLFDETNINKDKINYNKCCIRDSLTYKVVFAYYRKF